MAVLEQLEPKAVFHYFEELCNIPHPSYKEEKISNYLADFAQKRGLEYYQDELKNVIIIKEATTGYESVPPIILQGHMDMVCEKEPGCMIDFEQDGLKLKIEGDYITAEGTTLGGDDGIAVAYALAILDSETIAHPRIEFVCTVSEEVGMEGASGIDVSMLKGRKLLNLDSEDEGIMLASCAGGCSAACSIPVKWFEKEGKQIDITVSGLVGGHSGTEIDKCRANSNLLMARILMEAGKEYDFNIAALQGGSKDNAIPRETKATIIVKEHAEEFITMIDAIAAAISNEYSTSDPDIKVSAIAMNQGSFRALTDEASYRTIILLNALPNGIQAMSADIQGLVETSLNLGVLILNEEKISARYAVRSSVGTAKDYVLNKLVLITEQLGGKVDFSGDYPAWEYKKDSKLREDMVAVFERMYGRKPEIQAIHAGVECGILAGKLDGLDCISIGPDMIAIHTTEEKLSISSTKRVWEYVLEVLKCK